MLYKATGTANVKQWFWFLDAVLWADQISVRKRLGCLLYYMLTSVHSVLPLDVKEVTWLVGFRARALAKHQIHIAKMRSQIDPS